MGDRFLEGTAVRQRYGNVRRYCDVVWRSGPTLGVQFVLSRTVKQGGESFVDATLARIGNKD